MTKVFLSYDREDRSLARKIAAAMEGLGHTVWWDRHIRGGAEFSKQIDQALEAAEAVVVLWSKKAIASAWVRDEAATGRDSGRLVPVRIDDCSPPLGFRQYQTIDLLDGGKLSRDSGLAELDEALRQLAPGEGGRQPSAGTVKIVREPFTRRGALVGGAATALAAGGGAYFWLRRGKTSKPPPEVEPLLMQAKQLINQNTREGQYQAIGLYQRVVRIAPDYADGWGHLGRAYGIVSHYRERAEGLALRAKAEAAGRRALELDPNSAMGEVALSVALPFIGHWAERERRLLRALALQPKDDDVLIFLGVALQFAGRSTEAVPFYLQVKHEPLTPAEYTNFIRALWSAGRAAELEQAISDSASLYPTQASLWSTRVSIAAYSGQASGVAAIVEDKQARPSGVSDEEAAFYVALARAVQSQDPVEAESIVETERAAARRSAGRAEHAIRNASAVGRLDDAFVLADAYYFARRFSIPDYPEESSAFSPEQRQTRLLFEPVTKPMRADPRFEALVKELGFDSYWRASGKPPDYRHIPGL